MNKIIYFFNKLLYRLGLKRLNFPGLFLQDCENDNDYVFYLLREKELYGRFKKMTEIPDFLRFFIRFDSNYDPKLLINKKSNKENTEKVLIELYEHIGNMKSWKIAFDQNKIERSVLKLKDKLNVSSYDIFHPLRIALTGRQDSPSWLLMLSYLGFAESMNRIEQAIINIDKID